MDSFLTPEELAARSAGAVFDAGSSWLRKSLVIEERAKAVPPGEPSPLPPARSLGDETFSAVLAEIASTIGSAAAILDRCFAAARAQGYFESTLMGFRDMHMELSDLHSGLEAVRLMTYRACRLLDRADRERAGEELSRTREKAKDVAAKAARAGSRLLAGETETKGADRET